MKKLLGLLLVLVIVILGAFYLMGVVTEKTLKKNLNLVNQTNGIQATIKTYDRGWFSSKMILTWDVHVPPREIKNEVGATTVMAAQDFQLDMPVTICHGPIIFSDGVQFGLGYGRTDISVPQAYDQQFAEYFAAQSTKPNLALSVFVNYLGKTTLKGKVPAFTLIAKQSQDKFHWLGASSDVSMTADLNRVAGSFNIDGADWEGGKAKVVFGKARSNYDLHRTTEGLFLGDIDFVFPAMVVTEDGNKIFDLAQLEFASDSDVTKGLLSSHLTLAFERIFAHGKNYGPAKLALGIKNLDAEVLARINQTANNMKQGNDMQKRQALFQLLPEVPKLFAKGPVFEVSELTLASPEGSIEGNLKISLPVFNTDNPFALLQKLDGHAKLSVPVALVQEYVVFKTHERLLKTQTPVSPATPPASPPTTTPTPDTATVPDANSPTTAAPAPVPQVTVAEQAKLDAQQSLASMVQSGLLVQKGNDYLIELSLKDGHLTVNGKPFNSAMLKF